MNYEEMIQFIEDKNLLLPEKDYYYHAFVYNQNNFINMINKGIKSAILLGKHGSGLNGNFYVSLSKKETTNVDCSIYNQLLYLPMFIINDEIKTVKAVNCKKNTYHYPRWIRYSPLPFRETIYDDEYQKFLQVSSKDIVGIEYNLKFLFNRINKSNIIEDLVVLRNMINDLNSQKLDLPIIDYSSSREINKEKVLSLHL